MGKKKAATGATAPTVEGAIHRALDALQALQETAPEGSPLALAAKHAHLQLAHVSGRDA